MKIKSVIVTLFIILFFISINSHAKKPIPPRGFTMETHATKQKKEPFMILPSCFIQTGPAIVTHPFGINPEYGVFSAPLWSTGAIWVMPVGTAFEGTVIYTPLWWATDNDYKEENK